MVKAPCVLVLVFGLDSRLTYEEETGGQRCFIFRELPQFLRTAVAAGVLGRARRRAAHQRRFADRSIRINVVALGSGLGNHVGCFAVTYKARECANAVAVHPSADPRRVPRQLGDPVQRAMYFRLYCRG